MAPRSRRFSSCSLPRFRSQPIQQSSVRLPHPPAVQQQEAFAIAARMDGVQPAMPSVASRSSGSSAGMLSAAASVQSERQREGQVVDAFER